METRTMSGRGGTGWRSSFGGGEAGDSRQAASRSRNGRQAGGGSRNRIVRRINRPAGFLRRAGHRRRPPPWGFTSSEADPRPQADSTRVLNLENLSGGARAVAAVVVALRGRVGLALQDRVVGRGVGEPRRERAGGAG